MRKYISAILLFITVTTVPAQDILYNTNDSIFITHLLQKYQSKNIQGGTLILNIANEFIGTAYVAGTLEKGSCEPLVINTQEVDCTTFVEQVAAIYATIKEGKEDFDTMCKNLLRIRYRGGIRNGYASRLHYISQWISDSAKLNLIKEIDYGNIGHNQRIDLHFMSNHPGSYKLLKKDSLLVEEIRKWEYRLCGSMVKFIPKERLNQPSNKLPVTDGDIVALTTNIDGLDVTHIGFAFWEGGQLHMLHASSAAGAVIKDKKTLYEYQKNKKNQTGIRVFRME